MDDALEAAEAAVAETVRAALREVADEFAGAVEDATELVAARFSVGRIARMWRARVPRLMRRLLGVAETAAHTAADSVDAELPPTWQDLPDRHEDGTLPAELGQYAETTEHLLRAVGDKLAEVARTELAAGLDAGETVDQLRDRLHEAFAREGSQLGSGRASRIAATEATRAWNCSTLAAAQALTSPDRPLVKQWRTRRDSSVRSAHRAVDGTVRLLDEPFRVGGHDMEAPGDPTAPASLVVNCRCRIELQHATSPAASDSQVASAAALKKRRSQGVGHNTEEDESAGTGTADVTAAATTYTGAMVALIPAPEDAERLAVAHPDAEPAQELHLTLTYLGEGADWSSEQRQELTDLLRDAADSLGPVHVHGNVFGVAHWNGTSDEPAWVWNVGDDPDRPEDAATLDSAHAAVTAAVASAHTRPDMPPQHSPWAAHVCAAYSKDTALLPELTGRLGPVRFDRIRVAFAGDHTDIPLAPEQENAPMPEETTAAGMPTRGWSTPDGTALAFENEQSGDGRVFAAGAIEWSTGPWPLQYADEMLSGHQGAELAGSIQTLARDGQRITGTGVLYLQQRAGEEAAMLLDEGAALGVSVDLDDVDLELVVSSDAESEVALAASLPAVSAMQMDDGSWWLTVTPAAEWETAAGVLTRNQPAVQLVTGPGGQVSASAILNAFAGAVPVPDSVLRAAAGDPDDPDGTVVHQERSGDYLLRITRARLRGATLVAVPAFDRARIVLDPEDTSDESPPPADRDEDVTASGTVRDRVISYVRTSPGPVRASDVAKALSITVTAARGHLSAAAKDGVLVRLSPGLYVAASTIPEGVAEETASAHTLSDSEDQEDEMTELLASAWTAMQDLPPMPAAWFAEPTEEELPPGSGGVHFKAGRIYGWVAQNGEPHAGYPGQNLTIEKIAKKGLDLSHFLRAKFALDDGTEVRAGAFTMNVGHAKDGAETSTAEAQFDNTRTVAGIVTVGRNQRGLWFSGAMAPWLSEWDRRVFLGCQPSYHLKQGRDGRWQLRAVLSVPVPGHSSPLLATAVQRSNMALAASAAAALTRPAPAPVLDTTGSGGQLTAALLERPETLDALLDALAERQKQRETERKQEIERLAAIVASAA